MDEITQNLAGIRPGALDHTDASIRMPILEPGPRQSPEPRLATSAEEPLADGPDFVETNALVDHVRSLARARVSLIYTDQNPELLEQTDEAGGSNDHADPEALSLIPASSASDPALATRRQTQSEANPALVYLMRLGTGSRRTMREALDVMAGALSGGRSDMAMFPWEDLRYGHTAALRALLVERYAPATVNKMLAGLRGTLKEAWRLGLMNAEEYGRAADVASVRATTLLRGRSLSGGELRVLLEICAADPTAAGARDGALVATLYGAGLRRSEAAALTVANYDLQSGAITIRGGKGRKDRIAYAPSGSQAAIEAWIGRRGSDAGMLFQPVLKSGKIVPRGMTDQAILYILRKRQLEAALSPFTPHDLRRSFVSDLLDVGADIATVQQMAGHANVQTTARYDRRGERAKKKAADLLHVPYSRASK